MLAHKHSNGTIKYIRENIKDYFMVDICKSLVKLCEQGKAIPRFYLPVYRKMDRGSYVCWIFPLAPIVALIVFSHRAFWSIWNDFIWMIDDLRIKNK